MTPKQLLAQLSLSEIEDFVAEACFFLPVEQIASAMARGCTDEELARITRLIWLQQESENEAG